MEELNRIKVALCERKITSKELALALGKSQCTVSRWCNNVSQPDLSTLNKIAEVLEVDPRELLNGKRYR